MLSKIKKVLTNPKVNFVTGLMMGLIIMATGVYAATLVNSKNVTYDNSNSTLSSTNVQDALDELYNEYSSDPRYELGTPTPSSPTDFKKVISSSGSNIFAKKQGNQLSVCLYYNNNLFCMKNGEKNWEKNKAMLNTETFPDGCTAYSSYSYCDFDQFTCGAYSDGKVYCNDDNLGHYCEVNKDGEVLCN